MIEFEKWWKDNMNDLLGGYYYTKIGWKAALEWVLKEKEPQGPGTSGRDVLDMIKEELSSIKQ